MIDFHFEANRCGLHSVYHKQLSPEQYLQTEPFDYVFSTAKKQQKLVRSICDNHVNVLVVSVCWSSMFV